MSEVTARKADFPEIVELNVGGVFYTTSLTTLIKEPSSLLGQIFGGECSIKLVKDSKGKYFIDRDGVLFRYILDFLRNQKIVLPENFHEKDRLRNEAEHFKLPEMVKGITATYLSGRLSPVPPHKVLPSAVQNSVHSTISEGRTCGVITLGYRGTFAFGRDGLADVKFRKLSRIIVCGRVSLCREVFKDTLNESRDPDRGCSDRYTSRFFLKHSFLEQAFDMLQEEGFRLIGSCGSGTNNAGEVKPGMDTEEAKWQHYNEFIFERR
ncbi:BTB/POZ domain-containing protein KCTD16-like [Ruditapes philippinarum]|uniref:BTB/POZ domain-containing protein KCTD16-like n=1 Tax=Ruditapes philippinarum TaxID=129788 RepID=UPI00295B96DE|nr:BTB/POZ domain-containing protein KCTD16-like [Ruditapes philippinarum]